jgi:hypothetical protein
MMDLSLCVATASFTSGFHFDESPLDEREM